MGAVSHHWTNFAGVHDNDLIKFRALIRLQRQPVFASGVKIPIVFFGREFTPFKIIKGRLIRRDHAAARAGFDGHITDRHAAFHAHLLKDIAAIFKCVACAAANTDFRDDSEDNIFWRDTIRQCSIDFNCHGFGLTH